jgi:hypothetical protein
MAKKKNRARVPKRIAGMKIPKRVRRTLRPFAAFVGTEFGSNVVAGLLVALAGAFATTDEMRDSFKDAAKRMRKSGGSLEDLALHLTRAVVLPALVALHAKLPGEVRAEQHARDEHEDSLRAAEAVH